MVKQFVLSVKCPHCGTSFMDEGHIVNGQPGIKINIETQKERGVLWLCPIYDCFKNDSSVEINEKEVVNFYCPHCNQPLKSKISCELCDAPMAGLTIKSGGKVSVCTRKGCTNHHVVFQDLNDSLGLFYEEFGGNY